MLVKMGNSNTAMKKTIKRYWNKFLNWLIPNRRQKILIKMMKESEEMGLYDEPFNTKEK